MAGGTARQHAAKTEKSVFLIVFMNCLLLLFVSLPLNRQVVVRDSRQ
jgi:hypothetical protein